MPVRGNEYEIQGISKHRDGDGIKCCGRMERRRGSQSRIVKEANRPSTTISGEFDEQDEGKSNVSVTKEEIHV